MNSTAFARLCGVQPQTVLNWVASGKVVPTQSVGGKYFFSKECFLDFQVSCIVKESRKSFLGLIANDDDSTDSYRLFSQYVSSRCPSARHIVSLRSSLESMAFNHEVSSSDVLLTIFRVKVFESFIKELRNSVWGLVFDAYRGTLECRDFAPSLLLKLICGVEVEGSFVVEYGNAVPSGLYSLAGLSSGGSAIFERTKSDYGITELDGTLGDMFYFYSEGYSVSCKISKTAKKSSIIYDNIIRDFTLKSAKSGLKSIYENGYFTIVSGEDIHDTSKLDGVLSCILNGEYSFIFVDNSSLLPDWLFLCISSLAKSGKVDLVCGVEELGSLCSVFTK